MLIIDSHVHLGGSTVTGGVHTEADRIDAMEKWGVDISLLLPLPHDPATSMGAHDRIHRLVREKPGSFFGVVDLPPTLEEAEYWREAERCLKQLGFVAVKLHPQLHPCNPLSPIADKVFEVAEHFGVPVIVHTGLGSPWSLPSLLIPRAKRFPSVPIVLAHAGAYYYTPEAIVAAEICDNIFLETSWCAAHRIKEAVKKLGSDRVMMGSDVLTNLPVELTKFRTVGLTDSELEDGLGRTAARVFRLAVRD